MHSDIGIDDCSELRDILSPLVTDALPALLPSLTSKQQQQSASFDGNAASEFEGGVHALSGVPVALVGFVRVVWIASVVLVSCVCCLLLTSVAGELCVLFVACVCGVCCIAIECLYAAAML